jgi:membrane protein
MFVGKQGGLPGGILEADRSGRLHTGVGMGGLRARIIRMFRLVAWGFVEDRCLLRASALTYTTLLSLVPFLTIAFAILKGLGFQDRLELLLLEQFTPASKEVIGRIMDYVDRTNASSLGVAGTVGLLLTAVMTMRNMEAAFNRIWQVAKGRGWVSTLTNYVSVLVIAPVCGLVALSLTTYFNSPAVMERMDSIWLVAGFYRLAIRWSPLLILWVAFTACYALVPNTKVRISSAMLGGVVAAVLWQLAQWAYVRYQFGVARYHAIYGALSQLPILMVWIYASWVIVLVGAELARAHQESTQPEPRREPLAYPQAMLEVLGAVAGRFASGLQPFALGELLQHLPMDPGLAMVCLIELQGMGWLAPCREESDLVVFQRDPSRMELSLLIKERKAEEGEQGALGIKRKLDTALAEALREHTVADLMGNKAAKGKGEAPPGGEGREAG